MIFVVMLAPETLSPFFCKAKSALLHNFAGAKSAMLQNFAGHRMKAQGICRAKSALLHTFAGKRVIEMDPKCCEKYELPTIYGPNFWNHIAYTFLHTIYNLISENKYFVSHSL